MIDSKDRLQPFKRDRLFLSVYDSLRHRKSAISDAEGITATIISKLARKRLDGRLDKHEIVDIALSTIKHFDKAAAVHYKAFYEA